MSYSDTFTKLYTAGEQLERSRLVKFKSGSTTSPREVEYADTGDDYIGCTVKNSESGDLVTVKLKNAPGTIEGIAGEADITHGDTVYTYTDGKVGTTDTTQKVGVCVSTISTGVAGDRVEIMQA